MNGQSWCLDCEFFKKVLMGYYFFVLPPQWIHKSFCLLSFLGYQSKSNGQLSRHLNQLFFKKLSLLPRLPSLPWLPKRPKQWNSCYQMWFIDQLYIKLFTTFQASYNNSKPEQVLHIKFEKMRQIMKYDIWHDETLVAEDFWGKKEQ